jgi:LPXTG-motif cell wall-anchored protein
VWAGDEAPPPMPALLVPAEGGGDGGGWRAHTLLLAIAGGVLVLALGWFAGRRNRKEAA